MESIISAKDLFSRGNDVYFQRSIKSVDVARVRKISADNALIISDHQEGLTNFSFESTCVGSMKSLEALVGGMADEPKVHFFGERIRESVKIISDFFKK